MRLYHLLNFHVQGINPISLSVLPSSISEWWNEILSLVKAGRFIADRHLLAVHLFLLSVLLYERSLTRTEHN